MAGAHRLGSSVVVYLRQGTDKALVIPARGDGAASAAPDSRGRFPDSDAITPGWLSTIV